LVDIENTVIVGGCRLRAAQGQPLLEVVEARVRGMQVRAATGEKVLTEFLPALGPLSWGLTLVSTEPDAADRALLEAADDFVRRGVTDLVVASGDHAFAALASKARVHVLAHRNHLSKRLRLAATSVAFLPAGALPLVDPRTAGQVRRETSARRVMGQ
jgi:hypothetical protein